jgi:hypothetical protein
MSCIPFVTFIDATTGSGPYVHTGPPSSRLLGGWACTVTLPRGLTGQEPPCASD